MLLSEGVRKSLFMKKKTLGKKRIKKKEKKILKKDHFMTRFEKRYKNISSNGS